jgi:ribonuclease HII
MVAAAVILGEDFDPSGIRSSKKMRPTSRMRAYDRIMSEAKAVAVRQVRPDEIDNRGIDVCHMELLRDAVKALDPAPDYVLVDHYHVQGLRQPQESINGGDDLSVTIAAASIVAKVTCDGIMVAYEREYPGYGFAQNRGYRSQEHLEALHRMGPSPIHRRSVSPVKRLLSNPE